MIRFFSRGTQVFIDLFTMSVAYWYAFMFRFEFDPSFQTYKLIFFTWPYVVVLKYLEGWRNHKIAETVNKQVGAVKALEHRALRSLRRILMREEVI